MATSSTPPAANGPVDNDNLQQWMNRFNDAAADVNGVLQSKSPEDASSWSNGFWNFLTPPDLCLTTWFLPCVTFGKTYHRLYKDADLKGYEPVNTTCLPFCGTGWCLPLWAIPIAMQRAVIRARYNLQGGCISDLAWGCCCNCCTIIQMEK